MLIFNLLLSKVQSGLQMFNFNKKKKHTDHNSDAAIIDMNSSTRKPKELGKNKWLYPADEFVEKWKKPKHYKSITFEL